MKETINNTLAQNLTELMEKKGISQNELARRLEAHPSSVNFWCRGLSMPRADKIDAICRVLNCTTADLMLDHDILTKKQRAVAKDVPLYGEISAGYGYFSDSNIEKYIAVDASIEADFAVRVRGDSMINAGINDGDIALLVKDFQFKEGQIYAVWQSGDDVSYLKRVYIQSTQLLLVSENSQYPPIMLEATEGMILGELTGIYRMVEQ